MKQRHISLIEKNFQEFFQIFSIFFEFMIKFYSIKALPYTWLDYSNTFLDNHIFSSENHLSLECHIYLPLTVTRTLSVSSTSICWNLRRAINGNTKKMVIWSIEFESNTSVISLKRECFSESLLLPYCSFTL